MQSDIYEPIWFKLDMMIDTTKLYILMLVYLTLTLIQGQGGARKQTAFVSVILYSFQWIWMECSVLLRFIGLMSLMNRPVFKG